MRSGNSASVCSFFEVDPGNTGRVGPTEAALFLKKSGLPDITLGKVGGVPCAVSVTLHRAAGVYRTDSANPRCKISSNDL